MVLVMLHANTMLILCLIEMQNILTSGGCTINLKFCNPEIQRLCLIFMFVGNSVSKTKKCLHARLTSYIIFITKARFHVAVRTQINKFVFYFIVGRNVKNGCSEC